VSVCVSGWVGVGECVCVCVSGWVGVGVCVVSALPDPSPSVPPALSYIRISLNKILPLFLVVGASPFLLGFYTAGLSRLSLFFLPSLSNSLSLSPFCVPYCFFFSIIVGCERITGSIMGHRCGHQKAQI
jgi:hypothetical protein